MASHEVHIYSHTLEKRNTLYTNTHLFKQEELSIAVKLKIDFQIIFMILSLTETQIPNKFRSFVMAKIPENYLQTANHKRSGHKCS